MDTAHLVPLFFAIGLIAFLYSSVGHAGASGYIATMTLFGLAPTVIRPTALVLNILVASIGAFQFWRAGHFSWKLFWPFALLSIPAAYIGCNYWGYHRFAFGKQAFCRPSDFALSGDSASNCGNETDSYKVGAIDLNRPGASGEPTLPPVSARSVETRGWFRNRMRRFDRRIFVKARKARRHPIRNVVG